ncbi:MAG: hypothetical protein ACE5LU_10665 [Anaerolineae bacterium]
MKPLDTTAEAHQVQLDILRRLGPQGRLQKALELTELSRELLAQGVRQRHPEYSEEEVRLAVIRLQLPEGLFSKVSPHIPHTQTMTPEQTLKIVIEYLEAAGVDYMITGSFASNFHGVPRTTQDADVVIEVSEESLEQLLTLIEDEFYVSDEAAREALRTRDMFNIIHFETAFKVDLIIRKQRAYAEEEFKRRQSVEFLGKECWFASPEDTILAKLEWSKRGQSERQYSDALGVAQVQSDDLDWDYLQKWAERLDVGELYQRLVREVRQK